MSIPITCFNISTALKSSDMFLLITAINAVLPTFNRAWGHAQYVCVASPSNTVIGTTGMYCVFMDNTDSAGALAYHSESASIPLAKVFVKTILGYGGSIFASPTGLTVAQSFCHEIMEMIHNPNANNWWQQPNGTLVPSEMCDPVQSNVIPVQVGSTLIYLSDFILPAWSNPQATKGPYNYLNTLVRPFQIAKGGYVVQMRNGTVSYVLGSVITPALQDEIKERNEGYIKCGCVIAEDSITVVDA